MNILKSSGITTSSFNGKLIDQQAFNAHYDGNNAIIETLNNGNFKKILLDKNDINNILESFFENKINKINKNNKDNKNNKNNKSSSNNKLLLDKLISDYKISVQPSEYYNNLKDTNDEIKNLFTDITKIKKTTSKNKKVNKKANKNKKTNKKK